MMCYIELVSDFTSVTFIGALKKFVSRSGKSECLYFDNGTTFVKAHRQLKEYFDFLNNGLVQTNIKNFLCSQEVTWSFITPNSQHVSGL